MKEFYEYNDEPVSWTDLNAGLYVAASYSCLWHRAKILKVSPHGTVRVLFIDFGTVGDIKLQKVRFLTEEFLSLPCFAQRGVLSFVQPDNGQWNEESMKYFKKSFLSKKFEAKIFKKSDKDSSYFLALKCTVDKTKVKLVSDILIEKGFCNIDLGFLEKENFNEKEMHFIEYENGKHLDEPTPDIKQKQQTSMEEWLPTPSGTRNIFQDNQKFENNLINSSIQSSGNNPNPTQSQNPAILNKLKNNVLKGMESNAAMKYIENSLTRLKITSDRTERATTPSTPSCQIVEQKFTNIRVGATTEIYIHFVHDFNQFYFYLKDELLEIKHFLKAFK